MATFTAQLSLTDSGNTYSATTSTPLKMNAIAYDQVYSRTIELAATIATSSLNIGFDPLLVMIRCIDGDITVDMSDDNSPNPGTVFNLTGTAGDNGAKGWLMYGNSGAGNVNEFLITNASGVNTAQVEIIAYG